MTRMAGRAADEPGSPWSQQWMEQGPWVYTFHGGGWMLAENQRGERVTVRFQLSERGRLEPVELRLDGPVLDSSTLRRLPLTIMETFANTVWRGELRDMLDVQPVGDLHDRSIMPPQFGEPGSIRRSIVRKTARLKVPDGPKPDSFYQQVAKVYGHLARGSNRPAVELAEVNGVPVTTAHRWVKEARRRGFLAPGQKGRRG
jgi:hypothetical protein